MKKTDNVPLKVQSEDGKEAKDVRQDELYCMIAPTSEDALTGDADTTVCANRS